MSAKTKITIEELEKKITRLPWKVEENVSAGGVVHLAITNRAEIVNWMPCSITPMEMARPVDYDNAQFIKHCTAHFLAVVEALREMMEGQESDAKGRILSRQCPSSSAILHAKAVLERASHVEVEL